MRSLEKYAGNDNWETRWAGKNGNSNCNHGAGSSDDWWTGHLDGDHKIYSVRLFKRTDCCGYRAELTMTVGG